MCNALIFMNVTHMKKINYDMIILSELLQYRYDVLASLYWIPCTLQELAQRDFCKNLPTWYIDEILLKLETLGLVVKRKDGVYKAVKGKAKKVLNQRGYEIDD